MNFTFLKKSKKIKHKKDGRINSHRFWLFCMTGFLLAFTLIILWSTYFFIQTAKSLDTVVAPRLETNSAQVTAIEQSIQKTEAAVSGRTGQPKASQNTTPIVQ